MKRENAKEASLRTLMIAGLNGDTAAYRALLSGLSGHLRAHYRGKLVRAGRGTEEPRIWFRKRRRERAPDHCGLMPANLITLVHLSIFSPMNFANSSGEFGGTATAARSANRCLMFGSSTAALVCLLSVAMISGGVRIARPSRFDTNRSLQEPELGSLHRLPRTGGDQ